MSLLSVIVPCYNEEKCVNIFYNELLKHFNSITKNTLELEILFIDDGSTDHTLEQLKKLNKKDSRANYISFSRNFGKESAIYSGLQKSKGDYVVLMDCDLQDPPSYLPLMIDEIVENGFDCVATRRVTRKGEPPIRSFFARMFYKLINKISKTQIVDGARDYRMMTRQVVDSILSMCEYNRFTKGIFGWVGFNTKWLEYENIERVAGETKWSFWKLFLYSLDGITAFSTVPLAISSVVGFLFCIISFIMIIFIIVKTLIWGDPVDGYPSLVCIIFFLAGIQLFVIGILGQYLAKTYLETKKRPLYIEKESSINKND